MTFSTENFKPRPHARDDRPAAADPGQGAPPPADGFGRTVEEPDVIPEDSGDDDA